MDTCVGCTPCPPRPVLEAAEALVQPKGAKGGRDNARAILGGRRRGRVAARPAGRERFTHMRSRHFIESVRVLGDAVRIRWADKHVSTFHHLWLRDHCPSRYHPSSGQRMLPLSSIPIGVAPSRLAILGGTGTGQTLEIAWLTGGTQAAFVAAGAQSAAALSKSSPAHVSSFEAAWLREHCYSESARRLRAASGDVAAEGGALPRVRVWGPEAFAASPLPRVAWLSILDADPGAMAEAEAARESAALHALELLHAYGFVLVDGVAGSVEATRELAQCVGLILPSIYGDIWDTGGELQLGYKTDAEQMVDTAYSNASLPLHTDGSYMIHPPGLQLFNCVAQSDVLGDQFGPEAGCTRLADGLAAAAALREASPAAFDFFCGTPLPFVHRAGDAYVRSRAPVFRLDRATGWPAEVRYNETDRDIFDSLSAAEVEGFYKHARALQAALSASELRFKLAPGVALLLDNHRVLHGRVGFEGRRNLIGCYLTADDWRSNLRVRRAGRRAAESAGTAG